LLKEGRRKKVRIGKVRSLKLKKEEVAEVEKF